MVQVNWISGFNVGIEFFAEEFDHGAGVIIDLGIIRILYESLA